MQDLLPTEVKLKQLRSIYARILLGLALHQSTKESHDRHQFALACLVHKISSWARIESDNLLDGWQLQASCKPR